MSPTSVTRSRWSWIKDFDSQGFPANGMEHAEPPFSPNPLLTPCERVFNLIQLMK